MRHTGAVQLPRRRAPKPVEPLGPDAAQQAEWDAELASPLHGRRVAILALALVALLVAGVLVVARVRGDGGLLALGSTPRSSTIPPVENLDPITGDPLFEGSQSIAPGDPLVPAQPGVPPAGATDPAAAAAAAAAAGQPAAAGGTTGGVTGTGDGAGSGIPIPTTGPGGAGGGGATTTTTSPGGTTTTTVPGQPPPPPSCSVSGASVSPNPVARKGQSGRLSDDLKVEFRPTAPCGTSFRVQVNGLNLAAAARQGGLFVATIQANSASWNAGSYPIAVKISGGTTIATIQLTVT